MEAVEHCSWQLREGAEIDPHVASRMAAAGTFVGDTLAGTSASLLLDGVTPDAVPAAVRDRCRRNAGLRELGVAVVTNSDAKYPNRPFEDFPLGVAGAAIYGGLSPVQAVHTATGLAARSIGLGAEIGTLAPGRLADLLVVAGDVAAAPTSLGRPRWVIRGGEIAASDGRLTPARLASPHSVPSPGL